MIYSIAEQPILQALAADTHTLVFILDKTGRLLDVNQCFTRQTGYSLEEAKRTYIWQLFLSAEVQTSEGIFRKAFDSSQPLFYAHYWIHKTREPVFIEWSGSPFIDTSQDATVFICIGKDLSIPKKAEATLKTKEHKLEQLQRLSKTGYWEHDLVANTVSISSQMAEIYGFPYVKGYVSGELRQFDFSQKPYILHEIYNLVVESEKEEFKLKLQQIIDARLPFQWAYTVEVNQEQKRIYVEGEFVFDAHGKAVRMLGTTQDITQKFDYEQTLKYKEKLLDAISEAVISTDTDFIITSWNKGAEQIYGWVALEAIGKNVLSLLQTEFSGGSHTGSTLKEVPEKGIWLNKGVHTHKSGQLIHILSTSNKLLDEKNKHIGFVWVNRNISELVEIERKLLNNQANLIAVMENTTDSIYLVDTDFRIMITNSSCRQTLYKRFGIRVSTGDKITDKLPAPVNQSVALTLNKALEGNQFMYEATYTDKDKNKQIIESIVNPVKNELSQVIGIVVYTRNITERKKIQEEIVSLKIESEKKQATALMEGQEAERKRLMKELHDGIGQMLHVLKLKTDTLKDKFPQLNLALEDIAALIAQTISDVKSLIYDSMPYSLENLGLEGALRALVEQYQFNTRLDIQFQLWFNLKSKRFEKTLEIYIYRILQECLNNIAKHAQAKHVTIQLTQLPESLLLMVEDDGIGFNLEKKFKQNTGSSGLKNLIERCKIIHADVEIDTRPGHGCTVHITFPL